MADEPKKLTVEDLINVAIDHMDARSPRAPMIATFLRKCPCTMPHCTLEFLINVVPIDHIVHSVSTPTRIH